MHFSHGCFSWVKLEKKTWTIFLNMKTKVVHHQKSQSGQLCLPGKKSDLTDCIQSLSQPRSSAPTSINAAIIDGAAAINMLKPTNTVKTFQECRHHMGQEPMTRSLQLPYWANVTAFLQTDLFLDYLCRKKQRQFRFADPMTSG